MKKFITLFCLAYISLPSYAQYMGQYTEDDNEYGVCLDVNNLLDWEIKEYFYQYIDKGVDKAILYRVNESRSYENLRNAPSLLLSTMIISDTASYISGNRGYFIIDSLAFRPINTRPLDIKQLVITVEYYDCNGVQLYDLKNGKSNEVFIIKNIQGRGEVKTWGEMFSKIDKLFIQTLWGFTYKSNFYNKRKSACKIKSIKATYSNGKIETRWYSVKSTWLYEEGFDIEHFFRNSPFSPSFKWMEYNKKEEDSNINPSNVTETNNTQTPKDEVFNGAAHMPSFPGGDAALMKYIAQNIQYPKTASDNNIQGKVVVQFVVEKDGSVGDVRVVRSVDTNLDQEAIRVCKTLPKFTSGKNTIGDPVRVWYTLPITFKLQGTK